MVRLPCLPNSLSSCSQQLSRNTALVASLNPSPLGAPCSSPHASLILAPIASFTPPNDTSLVLPPIATLIAGPIVAPNVPAFPFPATTPKVSPMDSLALAKSTLLKGKAHKEANEAASTQIPAQYLAPERFTVLPSLPLPHCV